MTEAPAPGPRSGAWALLAGRIGAVAGALVTAQLLVGVTYVLAARQMAPDRLGLIVTSLAIGTISAVVFDLGLANLMVREVAAARLPMTRARSLVAAKRRLAPLLVVPAMAASVTIVREPIEGIALGLVGLLIWEAATANSLLRSLERFGKAASAQVAGRASGLVATIVLLTLASPEVALSVGLAGGFAVEAAIASAFLGLASAPAAPLDDLRDVHRRALSYGLVSLSASGQQLDTPLVTLGGGATAGGIYAGAGRLIGPLLFLSSALAMVAAPWLARTADDPVALRTEERRIGRLSCVLALAPLGAAALGPFVIPLLLGDAYRDSGTAFAVLAVGGAISTLSQGMASVLQNRGAERTVGVAIAIGLSIGLAATLGLAAAGGAVWAATGFLVSQGYILAHLSLRLREVRGAETATPGVASCSRTR